MEFKGEVDSPKLASIQVEIQQKKSALQVEGRSAESRSEEFNRMNYLLEHRTASLPIEIIKPINQLDIEALSLELDLINY